MSSNDVDLEQVQFKNIDEALRYEIVSFIREANRYYNDGDIHKGFNYYQSIFYLIQPKPFRSKEKLREYTKVIKDYLEEIGSKPINMAQKIQLSQRTMEFKDLVDEYFQMIPEALDELGLYLSVIKKRDDWDEIFSLESFNSNVSLLESKKESLRSLTTEQLVYYLSPVEVHNCHARIMLDVGIQKKVE